MKVNESNCYSLKGRRQKEVIFSAGQLDSWIVCKDEGGPAVLNWYVAKMKSSSMPYVVSLQATPAAYFIKKR